MTDTTDTQAAAAQSGTAGAQAAPGAAGGYAPIDDAVCTEVQNQLTQALGIDGAFDGADLVRGAVRLFDDGVPPPSEPGSSVRVGLGPGRGDEHPWRWFVADDENVSRARVGRRPDRRSREQRR